MRSFLLIAPCFAPQATVGAYRWVKLAGPLVRRGFRPVVVTGTFPDDARDPDLLAAVPPEVPVHDVYLDPRLRKATAALRSLAARFPRPKKTSGPLRPIEGLRPFQFVSDRWAIHALHGAREAEAIGRREGVSAVVVTAGPFSAIPGGFFVARALGVPLVLDIRDPWGLHESTVAEPPRTLGDRARKRLVEAAERRYMERADHVVLNTRRALAAYQERYPCLHGKSSFIRNHFDLALYDPPPARPEPPSRFTILHTGTLRAETRLDDIGAALARLITQENLTPEDLVLRQIGRTTDYERAQIVRWGLAPFVEVVPPVPQRQILGELRRAHVLLVMVDPRVVLRISAKTYDYAASGMPIVSITSSPEVDELLAHRPDNTRVRPGDLDGLTRVLAQHLARFRETRALPAPVPPPIELSSETAAERFAAIFDGLMG